MSFDEARAIADAVLLEGHVLYPYRASAIKNRFRWAFGVLAPRAWSEGGGCEPWWMETQCLVEPGPSPVIDGCLRFLHAQRRTVEVDDAPALGLDVDGRLLLPWDEGVVREIPLRWELEAALRGELALPFSVPGGAEAEAVRDAGGVERARMVRTREAVSGVVRVRAERVEAERPLVRLRVRVDNDTEAAPGVPRDEILRASCIATHVMLGVSGGAFVSLLDPPEWAAGAAGGCAQVRAFPVLAGAPGCRDLVLASPIILYDHPRIAPESPGDLFDATEIDELLTLRALTLTEQEKREARATDPRAAALLDRVEAMPPEVMSRLHGAMRDLLDAEMVPRAETAGPYGVGSQVRLRPGRWRTDAQDLLYAGEVATVEAIRHDVDGTTFVAVTIDGDPAADLHRARGLYHYYRLDEVEPLDGGCEASP